MKHHCPQCRMSFRVEEPRQLHSGFEVHGCSDCARRFWSQDGYAKQSIYSNAQPEEIAIVGIFPEDLKCTSSP